MTTLTIATTPVALPRQSELAVAFAEAEIAALSDSAGARLTAADLDAAARQALTNLASDVPDLAVTVGFTRNASFERAFDAGLVSWADDGALVWA